jgi:hypothetical protein
MVFVRRLFIGTTVACLSWTAAADVHLVRRSDGSALIFNEVGSGWRVGGRPPNDDYLLARRDAQTPWDDAIRQHADREGVDARLVRSVMLVESNFNPRAVSRKGARGLMQLMPATAREYGVKNAFDALENIRGGVKYLADLLSVFSGDLTLALAAYNAGPGAVARHGGIPPYPETREYVRRTLLAFQGERTPGSLSGGFRGVEVRPVRLAVPARAIAPVKLQRIEGVLLMANAPSQRRPAPVLGRVPVAGR